MNIGIYIINSKDKNVECGVGNTQKKKIQLHRLKKKLHYLQVFIIIFKGQLRDRARERKRQREVKGEYKDEGGRRRETRRHKKQRSGANRRIKHVTSFESMHLQSP